MNVSDRDRQHTRHVPTLSGCENYFFKRAHSPTVHYILSASQTKGYFPMYLTITIPDLLSSVTDHQ